MKLFSACLAVLLGLSPLAWSVETLMEAKKPGVLQAELESKSGSKVTGHITFTEAKDGVKVEYSIHGLKPNTEQGFHIHEKGDCSSPDGKSAGKHYAMLEHGKGTSTDTPDKHAGDLSPLKADANGNAESTVMATHLSINGKVNPIEGKAIVVHGGPDDLAKKSPPRVACGVIRRE